MVDDTESSGNCHDHSVAMCQLQFGNEALLDLLKKRGVCIKDNKIKQLNKLNKKIQELVSSKDNIRTIRRPVSAFITFNDHRTAEEALKTFTRLRSNYSIGEDPVLYGENLYLRAPNSPSDYIWENKGQSK